MTIQSLQQQFSFKCDHPHPDDLLLKTSITPSYFLFATWTSRIIRHIQFVEIQPNARNSTLAEVPIQLEDDESIQGFQLDEAQNLLAVVTTCGRPSQMFLRLLNFPDGQPHSLAASQPVIASPFDIEVNSVVQVQINQDLVGILIARPGAAPGSQFTLLNWKTANPVVLPHSETDRSMRHFSFLSPTDPKIVTVNEEVFCIEVWSFREESLQKLLSLKMPDPTADIEFVTLDCTNLNPDQLTPSSFSRERACVAFQLISHTIGGFVFDCGTTFILSAAHLIYDGHGTVQSLPWDEWGPGNVQLLDTTLNREKSNTGGPYYIYKQDPASRGHEDDPENDLVTIYDIGQAPREPEEHWSMITVHDNSENEFHYNFEEKEVFTGLVFGSEPQILEPPYYLPCTEILNQGRRLFALMHENGTCTVAIYDF